MNDELSKKIASDVAAECGVLAAPLLPVLQRVIHAALAQALKPLLPFLDASAPAAAPASPTRAAPKPGLARAKGKPKKAPARPAKKAATKSGGKTPVVSVEAIVAVLKGAPDKTLRSEALRARLKLRASERRALGAVLTQAVENGLLVRTGTKRATAYGLK